MYSLMSVDKCKHPCNTSITQSSPEPLSVNPRLPEAAMSVTFIITDQFYLFLNFI